jgi:hypothetical protein
LALPPSALLPEVTSGKCDLIEFDFKLQNCFMNVIELDLKLNTFKC